MIHICIHCGVEFEAKADKRVRYCSRKCQKAHHTIGTFICQQCGRSFESKGKDRMTFCSVSCSVKARHVAAGRDGTSHLPRPSTEHSCRVCGKAYMGRRNETCCSRECYAESERRRAYNGAQKKHNQASKVYTCRECGKVFMSPYGTKRREFCSEQCRRKCFRRLAKYKRRMLIGADHAEEISLSSIYIRDNGVCQLCGKRVNTNHKWPDLSCPSLDHIVPLSQGGAHESRNVQLAHFLCNTRKGTKVMHEQLRLL